MARIKLVILMVFLVILTEIMEAQDVPVEIEDGANALEVPVTEEEADVFKSTSESEEADNANTVETAFPGTAASVPAYNDSATKINENVVANETNTTDGAQTITEAFDSTTIESGTTTKEVEVTTAGAENTTGAADTSTAGAKTITDSVKSTTKGAYVTTEAAKSSTDDAETATEGTNSSGRKNAELQSRKENGDDPYVHPKHLIHSARHIRHVKAHDGFHSLKRERYWAHWNDAYTKAVLSLISNKT